MKFAELSGKKYADKMPVLIGRSVQELTPLRATAHYPYSDWQFCTQYVFHLFYLHLSPQLRQVISTKISREVNFPPAISCRCLCDLISNRGSLCDCNYLCAGSLVAHIVGGCIGLVIITALNHVSSENKQSEKDWGRATWWYFLTRFSGSGTRAWWSLFTFCLLLNRFEPWLDDW